MTERELENKKVEDSMRVPYTYPLPAGTVVFVLVHTHDGLDKITKQTRAKVIHEEEEFVTVEFLMDNKKFTKSLHKKDVDTSPHVIPYI